MGTNDTTVYGIDFSGAGQPGQAIWITEAIQGDEQLAVRSCSSASDLFDLSTRAPRDRVLVELREFVANRPNGVFGFDFPFGLPEAIIGDVDSWTEYVESFDRRFATDSADAFRSSCVNHALEVDSSERKYYRRETDWRYAAQCPYSMQIQYQTLHGNRYLLNPLVTEGDAHVVPMQEADPDTPTLVESYPAATLGVHRLHRTGYKRGAGAKHLREATVEKLNELKMEIPDDVTQRANESDDALDSLVAALAASRVLSEEQLVLDESGEVEGHIIA